MGFLISESHLVPHLHTGGSQWGLAWGCRSCKALSCPMVSLGIPHESLNSPESSALRRCFVLKREKAVFFLWWIGGQAPEEKWLTAGVRVHWEGGGVGWPCCPGSCQACHGKDLLSVTGVTGFWGTGPDSPLWEAQKDGLRTVQVQNLP